MKPVIRILTYNIHKGIGGIDRSYKLDRVVSVLRHYTADIVLLQEVDHGARRSQYEQQSMVLARELGMPHMAVGITHRLRTEGAYGNVTLSRWPIGNGTRMDLTQPMRKRRGALYTRVHLPDAGAVDVFNFHLGLSHYERMNQMRQILTSSHVRIDEHQPVVIAGDSNDWRGRICSRLLTPHGFDEVHAQLIGRRRYTFPAFRPVLALDRMYFRNLVPIRLVEEEHPWIRYASDHRPVVVDFARREGNGVEPVA